MTPVPLSEKHCNYLLAPDKVEGSWILVFLIPMPAFAYYYIFMYST